MNEIDKQNAPSFRSLAVAIVALTKYLSFRDPTVHLALLSSLHSAEETGLDAQDLRLLKLLTEIARSTEAHSQSA